MRVFFGIILGVALTVGVAFISDTLANDPPATTGSAQPSSSTTARWSTGTWSATRCGSRVNASTRHGRDCQKSLKAKTRLASGNEKSARIRALFIRCAGKRYRSRSS